MAPTDNRSSANTNSTDRLRDLVARLGDDDINRDLGGGWTVGFALAHLAFWDARQVAALNRFANGDGFPSEDYATNAALEAIASTFNPATIGAGAVTASEQLDAVVQSLTSEQLGELREAGLSYAVERAPHREEHMRQIEAALG